MEASPMMASGNVGVRSGGLPARFAVASIIDKQQREIGRLMMENEKLRRQLSAVPPLKGPPTQVVRRTTRGRDPEAPDPGYQLYQVPGAILAMCYYPFASAENKLCIISVVIVILLQAAICYPIAVQNLKKHKAAMAAGIKPTAATTKNVQKDPDADSACYV
ncbi:unnamed protein product, partial [Mesorhabditis spiculigera]